MALSATNPRETAAEEQNSEVEKLPSGDYITLCEKGNTEGWIKAEDSVFVDVEQ